MSEELLCISYFDDVIGPNVFYCNVPSLSDSDFPNLNRLLDFSEEEGSFIFAFKEYQTINLIFHIDSEKARGGQHLMMISYIVKASYFKDDIADVYKYLKSKSDVLKEFADKIANFQEISDILLKIKNSTRDLNAFDNENKTFENKFSLLYSNYFKKLSIKSYLQEKPSRNTKKIFVLGARKSGKSTFLKNIQSSAEYNQFNAGLPTRIFEAVIENMQLLSYDCLEKNFECYQCKNLQRCVNNAQGFIVIFSHGKRESLETVKLYFDSIVNKYSVMENKIVPVLLIGNKFLDKQEIPRTKIESVFNKEQLASCGMKLKYIPINLMEENDAIMKSLLWMVKRMI
ncbi:MAG: hypothetical protein ACFFAS_09405 [Promethearchaeota archaeon]